MINISSLANFLSINSEEVEDISSITRNDGNYITIKLKKKDCCCTHCQSASLFFIVFATKSPVFYYLIMPISVIIDSAIIIDEISNIKSRNTT